MTTYRVTRKSDGQEVYRYNAETAVEWSGFEFATHNHTPESEPVATEQDSPEDWRMYVGPFFDRFGAYKIAILSSTDPLVQAVIKDASVRKYIDLKARRAELLQVVGLLQSKGFAIDAAAVLDVKPTQEERFNG